MGENTTEEEARMSVNEKSATNQYLTFTLANEQYAVDVAKVREVISEFQLTVIPRMPEYIRGVINIRGSVVPVVDLRTKFGFEAVERTVDTSVIVMDLDTHEGDLTLGCLADSVQEVVNMATHEIEPPPSIGSSIDTQFIHGLGKRDERFIIVLDINRVFQDEDLTAVKDGVNPR